MLLEKIQHEGEIPFDEIDISNRSVKRKPVSAVKTRPKHPSSYEAGTKSNPEQVRRRWTTIFDFFLFEKLSIEIPSELHGIGTNQYTYFVTNSPGLPWIKLPDVKPATINHARNTRCLFTGCLSSEIDGFSPFFGLEKDYLRAQIARITATTHISPAGFYILTENEEGEETSFNNERKGRNNSITEIRND